MKAVRIAGKVYSVKENAKLMSFEDGLRHLLSGPRYFLVKGISQRDQDKVQNLFRQTMNTDDTSPRNAFLSILTDIEPISRELGVSKKNIVKVLLFGTGYNLPKKYVYLLKG
jgi:hypothetical protein